MGAEYALSFSNLQVSANVRKLASAYELWIFCAYAVQAMCMRVACEMLAIR